MVREVELAQGLVRFELRVDVGVVAVRKIAARRGRGASRGEDGAKVEEDVGLGDRAAEARGEDAAAELLEEADRRPLGVELQGDPAVELGPEDLDDDAVVEGVRRPGRARREADEALVAEDVEDGRVGGVVDAARRAAKEGPRAARDVPEGDAEVEAADGEAWAGKG